MTAHDAAAHVVCRLQAVMVHLPRTVSIPGTSGIEIRMGPTIVSCPGVVVAVTSITGGAPANNCSSDPVYGIEVTIARDCAREYDDIGRTISIRAASLSVMMSSDADILWTAYEALQPTVSWQINGGLAVTTASFQATMFVLPPC